jgi:hypothetical protein
MIMAGSIEEVRKGLQAAGVTEFGMDRAVTLYRDLFDAFEHTDWDHIKVILGGGDITVGLAVLAAARMVQTEELADQRKADDRA